MKKAFSIVVAAYSAVMLVILCVTVNLLSGSRTAPETATIVDKVTEYVYVYSGGEDTREVVIGSRDDEVYIIRQYMEMIGIFKEDGSLVEVIEVYVKTLPEADRRLLGEGFEVIGNTKLNSVIEDYTG